MTSLVRAAPESQSFRRFSQILIRAARRRACDQSSTHLCINPATASLSIPTRHRGTRMLLIVNQQPFEYASDRLDVPALLASRGVKEEAIAVAVNGEVVPRRRWSS